MNFSRKTGSEDVEINLTSLIDVVFLLIIFFMVTTTFQAKSGINLKLPESESQLPSEEISRVTLSIRADGTIFLKDKIVEEKNLPVELKGVAGENKKVLLIIRADKSVPHGKVVTVMDYARNEGLTNLAIATVRKPSQ